MMSRCCTYTWRSFYFSFLLTKMESLDSAAYKPLLKNKTILTVAGRSSKIKYGFVCNCFRFICTGCVFILKKKSSKSIIKYRKLRYYHGSWYKTIQLNMNLHKHPFVLKYNFKTIKKTKMKKKMLFKIDIY